MLSLAPSGAPWSLWLHAESSESVSVEHLYRLAEVPLFSDQRLPWLADPALSRERSEPRPDAQPRAGRLAFEGSAWLGGRLRNVRTYWQDRSVWIEIDAADSWWVDLKERQILRFAEGGLSKDRSQWLETLLGPPLLLALAEEGLFTLHASAALVEGRLCAFLGSSGIGKSTIAAQQAPGWQRVADDLLPFDASGPSVEARPGYPQLKLAAPIPDAAPCLPLAACFVLRRRMEMRTPIVVRRLAPRDAAIAVLRHTVAARLFDHRMLELHLEATSRLAEQVPVCELSYPTDLDQISAVQSYLQGAIAGITSSSPR